LRREIMELSRRAFNLGSLLLAAPPIEPTLTRRRFGHVELENPLPSVTSGTGTFHISGQAYEFCGAHCDEWSWNLGRTHFEDVPFGKNVSDRLVDVYFLIRSVVPLSAFHHLDLYSWVGDGPRTSMAKGSWAFRTQLVGEPEKERFHVVLSRLQDVYCLETVAPFGHAGARALRESFRPAG
jgi:hypothetical protein